MLDDARTWLKGRFPRAWNVARTTNKLRLLIPRVYGYAPRHCPICDYRGKFLAEVHFPDIFTFDAVCPACGSMPRNRLLKLAVDRLELLSPDARLLHFAPERPVTGFLAPRVRDYRTADINGKGVDLTIDIQAIDQPDDSWDVIVCSHVLEHVDHRRALRELHRILAPGGRLLALFPIVEAWPTDYENPEVKSPQDRGLHFGKENHLRRFGVSVRGDIVEAGFALEGFSPIGPEIVDFGLIPGETLFICTKA